MAATSRSDDLSAMLLKGRSAAFSDALAQLLLVYDAEIQALRSGCQGDVAEDEFRTAHVLSRSLPVKFADAPVNDAQDSLAGSGGTHNGLCDAEAVSRSEAQSDGLSPTTMPTTIGLTSLADGAARNGGLPYSNRRPRYDGTASTSSKRLYDSTASTSSKMSMIRADSMQHHQKHLEGLVRDKEVGGPGTLKAFVGGLCFELLSAAILLMFCLVTALDMQREGLLLGYELQMPRYSDTLETGWPTLGRGLQILTYMCSVLFAMEVLVRLLAFRAEFFGSVWNNLDVVVLISTAIEALLASSVNIRLLRVLRLSRLLRFAKMARFIRKVESLFFLMQALKASFRILTWSCLLLFAVQVCTAFFLTELLFFFYFPDGSAPQRDREQVFVYFGTFSRSLLTTFEMAMGNWPVPARVLSENVSEWFIIVFIAHKMIVGYSILGVINAVFVQETLFSATSDDMAMVVRKQRQMKVVTEKLDKLFLAADTSEDGRISRLEFDEILRHPDVRLWLASLDYDAKDPDALFDLLDKDKNGDLSADEFVKGMTSLRGQARAMDLLYLVDVINAAVGQGEDQTRVCHKIGAICPNNL